jgi:hypothetical protein
MNATLQHKLTDLAIEPPKGLWDKIATELDDSASGMQFPSRLHELAITPPLTAWSSIVGTLDRDIPANTVAAKLIAAEVIPPAMAWDKIETALDAEQTTAVPTRRIPSFVRYAAAAVLIGLIAFGSNRLINGGTKNPETAQTVNDQKTGTTLPVAQTDEPTTQEEVNTLAEVNKKDEEARNDAALEASKKTYAKLDITPKKKVDAVAGFNFASMLGEEIEEPVNLEDEDGFTQNGVVDNKRYIVLMTPDGHFIRMSKKLSDLLCCVSGEEEDIKCRTQVDKWRKQIACSPTPHPGNFMDILNLLGSLQDN